MSNESTSVTYGTIPVDGLNIVERFLAIKGFGRYGPFVRRIGLVLAALGVAACAPSAARGSRFAPTRFSSDLITWNELAAKPLENAYSAVEHIRPLFLSPRPGPADARGEERTIRVFIDGDFAGDQEVLRSIPVGDIESIRRVQPAVAYATLGSLHTGDQILLVRLWCRVAC